MSGGCLLKSSCHLFTLMSPPHPGHSRHHVTVLTLIDSAMYVRTSICTYLRTYVLIKMSSQLVLLVIVSPWSVMSHVRTLTLMSPCHCPPSCQTAMDLQEQQVQQTQAAQRPRVSGPVHPSHWATGHFSTGSMVTPTTDSVVHEIQSQAVL